MITNRNRGVVPILRALCSLRPQVLRIKMLFVISWITLAVGALRATVVEVEMTSSSSVCASGPFTVTVAGAVVSDTGSGCDQVKGLPTTRFRMEVGRPYDVVVSGAVCSTHLRFTVSGCYSLFTNGVAGSQIDKSASNPGDGNGTWQLEVRQSQGFEIDFDVPRLDDHYVLSADGKSVAHPGFKKSSGSSLTAPLTWSIVSPPDKLGCQINSTNGTIRAGEQQGMLLVKVADSSNPSCELFQELQLNRCQSCSAETCPISTVKAQAGSVDVRISMGIGSKGESVGGLTIYYTNSPNAMDVS